MRILKILLMTLSLWVSIALLCTIPKYGSAMLTVLTAIFCSLELCSYIVMAPVKLIRGRN